MSEPRGANPYTGLPARPRRQQPSAASTPATLPCGHPAACLSEVAPDFAGDTHHPPSVGTAYCRWCADVAKLAEAQQAFEELSKKQVEVHTWGLQVVDILGQALEKIIDDGQPLTSRIEIKTPDGRRFPVVWLWASVDPDGPVARIGNLAAHKQHAVAAARHWKAAAIEARLTVGVLLERLRQVEPGESVRYLAGTADAVALCAALAAEYIRRREQVALLCSALETCPHDSGCHPSEGIHTDACLQRKAALASVVHP